MRAGTREARNQLLKEVMRDYHYLEHMGMGVPRKIIQGMKAHNNTEPELIEDRERTLHSWPVRLRSYDVIDDRFAACNGDRAWKTHGRLPCRIETHSCPGRRSKERPGSQTQPVSKPSHFKVPEVPQALAS